MNIEFKGSIESAASSMRSAFSRLSIEQYRRERDYKRVARDILEAVNAKIQETGTKEFKIPESSSSLRYSTAKCGIWVTLSGRPVKLVIIEEYQSVDSSASRGVTIVNTDHRTTRGIREDFPFIRFTEEIFQGSKIEKEILADKDSPYDLLPRMLQFLEDIEKWEAVV